MEKDFWKKFDDAYAKYSKNQKKEILWVVYFKEVI